MARMSVGSEPGRRWFACLEGTWRREAGQCGFGPARPWTREMGQQLWRRRRVGIDELRGPAERARRLDVGERVIEEVGAARTRTRWRR